MKPCLCLGSSAWLTAYDEESEVSRIIERNIGSERSNLTEYVAVKRVSESDSQWEGWVHHLHATHVGGRMNS